MADNHFSIEDILSEYPKSSPEPNEDLSLTGILSDKPEEREEDQEIKLPEPTQQNEESLSLVFDDEEEDFWEEEDNYSKKFSLKGIFSLFKKDNSDEEDYEEYEEKTQFENKLPPINKKQKVYEVSDTDKLSYELAGVKPIEPKAVSGNTEMIDSLMRLKKKCGSRTTMIKPVERKNISDINLNLEDKILPDTEVLPKIPKEEQEKISDLKERRRQKVEEFVLYGENDDSDEEEYKTVTEETTEEVTDFESFDDAPSIIKNMQQLKKILSVRFFILLGLAILSLIISLVATSPDAPDILNIKTQTGTVLFVFILFGAAAVFSAYRIIYTGIMKLFSLKGDSDSLSALAIITSLLTAIISIAAPDLVQRGMVTIYISAAIFCLLFNTIGKLLIVSRTERNFQYVSGDYDRYAMYIIDDEGEASKYTRGLLNDFPILASMNKVELVTDFLKSSYAPDATDKFCKFATPAVAAGGILIGIIAALMYPSVSFSDKILIALSAMSATYALCSCMGIMLVVSYPMDRVSRKNQEYSSAMLSYEGIEDFSETNSVLIDAAQLFPQGTVKLLFVKLFSNARVDDVIIKAGSLATQSGSILKTMFYDMIIGKTEILEPVESYAYEDSLGICGWIDNQRILLGNREMMINHSISGIPTREKELEYSHGKGNIVYISIAGKLSALFVVELKSAHEIKMWMKRLEKNSVYAILRTVDSCLSITKLAELFEISPDMLKLMPFRMQNDYEEQTTYNPEQSATFICNGRFPSFAALIIRAKKIKKITHMGITIQSASAILGFLIMLILTISSALPEITPLVVVAYGLAWTVVTVLVQSIKKL